jgi:hypothetical protein
MSRRDYRPAVYDGVADLYVYFYARGLALLRPGGRLSYVVTNKWLKAGYAEALRAFFGERVWVEAIFDFGHAKKMFPDADVMPCVLVARQPDPALPAPAETQVALIAREDVDLSRLTAQVRRPCTLVASAAGIFTRAVPAHLPRSGRTAARRRPCSRRSPPVRRG